MIRRCVIEPSRNLDHLKGIIVKDTDIIVHGLNGVVVSETAVGNVNAQENYYQFRQYDAVELNLKSSFEDVWHLMQEGHLPTKSERSSFNKKIVKYRDFSPYVLNVLKALAKNSDTSAILKLMSAAIAVVSADFKLKATLDQTPEDIKLSSLQLCAVAPRLLASIYRLQIGKEPLKPNDEKSIAWNYLYMLNGIEPSEIQEWALERYLITVIDHGFNASTFTSRVISSTGADLGLTISGAISSLSGPLHGGAPSRVLDMLDQMKDLNGIEPWVKKALTNQRVIMGFGHRVYKDEDPRSELMKNVAERIGGDRIKLAIESEATILKLLKEAKSGRKFCTNVEFFSSVVMEACLVPRELFTPTFMIARIVGWCAHVIEQASNNKIYRPRSKYIGLPVTKNIPQSQ